LVCWDVVQVDSAFLYDRARNSVVTPGCDLYDAALIGKKTIRRTALVAELSRAIREGYPPGPERERWLRWLRWLTGIAAKGRLRAHLASSHLVE
jgi:hypothetical protein